MIRVDNEVLLIDEAALRAGLPRQVFVQRVFRLRKAGVPLTWSRLSTPSGDSGTAG